MFSKKRLKGIESSGAEELNPDLEVTRSERPEHLKEGIKPIFTCIGTIKDFKDDFSREVYPFNINDPNQKADNVDFYTSLENAVRMGLKTPARRTYVISPLNNRDKFSSKFYDCTGLVVVGRDKETGEELSLMSHLSPPDVLTPPYMDKFREDLQSLLEEIREKCEEGTIDAVVAGGHYGSLRTGMEYQGVIALLTVEVEKELGFDPFVVAGPKFGQGEDQIFFDTHNRRMYLIRPLSMQGAKSNTGYRPRDIDNASENW